MKSIFPLILIVLLLTGAISYALSKRAIPKEAETRFGIAANELKDNTIDTLTPTPVILSDNSVTPTVAEGSPSITPAIVEPVLTTLPSAGQKGGIVTQTTKTTKTVVCTPVYGQANTCTEHIVVDTGAQDAIFFNFAGLSYLAGLVAFIKSKYA